MPNAKNERTVKGEVIIVTLQISFSFIFFPCPYKAIDSVCLYVQEPSFHQWLDTWK